MTGNSNTLNAAMYCGTPEIVCMLLDRGLDPMLTDQAGNHPFLLACISNRVDNVKYWVERFPDWDLERPNRYFGGVALGCAVYMGPNRLELTQLLIDSGAKLETLTPVSRFSCTIIENSSSACAAAACKRVLSSCTRSMS